MSEKIIATGITTVGDLMAVLQAFEPTMPLRVVGFTNDDEPGTWHWRARITEDSGAIYIEGILA